MASTTDQRSPRRKIAVIGSGVSGLTAAHVLQRSADVTLYEAADRLGGHADTHDVECSDGRVLGVDTGFIVHNERTYPTLLRLFRELGVETQSSEMSMSIACRGCGLEYAGARGARGLFAQPRSLLRPKFLRMLAEVLRFHRAARRSLLTPGEQDTTLGEFLAAGGYSDFFVQHFMTPVVSCVWSCAPQDALRYPARYLFAFLDNHGMLAVTGSPSWRTVVGGSRSYVELAAKGLTAVQTSAPVRSVHRTSEGVTVEDDQGSKHFDGVVIATHPDQALAMLATPTEVERELLSAFTYSRNPTVLHTDASVLPRSSRARASWNYQMDSCATQADKVLVSYDMNRLQRLDVTETYIVTLNPGSQVEQASVVEVMDYKHPLFTPESVAAQRRLAELNDGVVAFAGAYHGWGFHEDGARAGVAAAESLGGSW